ncbi:MAG: ABC transporter permease [Caldilinea sp. CFX5]|nr:ABC transporter permease [Caldilinea sp. CFX5]
MTATTRVKLKEEAPRRPRTLWQNAVRHILHDQLTLTALVVLGVMTLLCLLGPPVVEQVLALDVNRTDIPNKFLAPGAEGHLLGTDHLGRDQLIRLLYGGRVSLAIAYSASFMAILIGVALGLIAGYYGGRVDDLITWAVTTLSSVPTLFLLLIASTFWTPSAPLLILILALLGWIGTCRLVRGEVLALKEREYILAAQAVGVSTGRLLVHHILPNVLPIVIVTMTIIAGNLILVESGLSFLGVGVQAPTPTWGNMLTDARSYFNIGTHLVIWPGILIMVTVLCFYLVGDGLRDALDPRSAWRLAA